MIPPCGFDHIKPWAKTIKKNTNSTQNKSQTHRAEQYEVTSFLSTDCELSTETCSKNGYSLGPLDVICDIILKLGANKMLPNAMRGVKFPEKTRCKGVRFQCY